ncbi:hypothetical protein DFH06DRAFT_1298918 [Mycena polygramma]|nr:hypothetical protein DFH06DRAFT_1298918 [Mycena polygramma]
MLPEDSNLKPSNSQDPQALKLRLNPSSPMSSPSHAQASRTQSIPVPALLVSVVDDNEWGFSWIARYGSLAEYAYLKAKSAKRDPSAPRDRKHANFDKAVARGTRSYARGRAL